MLKHPNSKKGQNDIATAISKAIVNFRNSRDANYQSEGVVLDKGGEELNPKVASLDLKPYNFKGLSELSLSKTGNLYRYYFSESQTYKKAQKQLKEAKSKGFKKAFIVAFDGDKKITISEALSHFK